LTWANRLKLPTLQNVNFFVGVKARVDIDIEYIGLRPGEKLHEELLISEEGVSVTKNDKIFIEKSRMIDFDKYMQRIKEFELDNLDDSEKVINFIKELVPTIRKICNRNFGCRIL